ncbi:MAG: glutaredoxin 3 [Alphaproteobacteria bacterium]|nr:glutaredoxin 3 [Alphaproteobacteria bacterium]
MPDVIIYTTPVCPYCLRAKDLFNKLGITYSTIDVSKDAVVRQKMVERSGNRQTVPQIFINDVHIGGYDDLYALYKAGGLNEYI